MSQQQKPKKSKNSDIQILRAVAIAAVLGFHLLPELFPQGYLGVDIFFVISGYLMTSILDDKQLSLETCLRFYERRLKRLLPAYILVIFLTLATTSLFLISTDYDFLKYDTLWAMFFGTNFQSMFEKETYFKLISDYKFLLHTWSLAVEFQYYLFAPLMLIPIAESGSPLIISGCLISASFAFQILIPYPTLAFGLVAARIWQFLIGTVVFHVNKSRMEQHLYMQLPEEASLLDAFEETELESFEVVTVEAPESFHPPSSTNCFHCLLKILIFTGIVSICFMKKLSDNLFYTSVIRLIAVSLSGLAIYFGYDSKPTGYFVWLQKAGIYIGNISYSLYLLHWPIIIFAKYQNLFNENSFFSGLFFVDLFFFRTPVSLCHKNKSSFCISGNFHDAWQLLSCCIHLFFGLLLLDVFPILVVIMALSIIQYHCYEKPFLTQPTKVVFSLIAIVYLCIIILLILPQGYIKNVDPAIAGNEKIAHECNALPQNEDCNWDPLLLEVMNNTKPTKSAAHYCSYDGTGNLTIFLTGNSFALRQLAAVKEALNTMYKKLYYVARPACLTFESFNVGYKKYWECDEVMNKTVEFLKKIKPDIMIITQKVSGNENFQTPLNSINDAYNDTTTKILAEYFQLWSPFVKHIYHIEPHPTLKIQPATTMAKELAQGKSLSHHFLTQQAVHDEVDPGWQRIKAAMKNCRNCVPIVMNDNFVTDKKYFYYDRKTRLSLFCDNGHLSPAGAAKMVTFLKKFFKEKIKEFQ